MTSAAAALSRLQQGAEILAKVKMALASVFLILMMVHVGADVLLKFILNKPIMGTLETVSYYYMVSLVFLPLAFVELRQEHVAVDLFFQMFPSGVKVAVYTFGCLIAIGYYGVFCYQTTLDALKATAERETVMANFLFYVWPSRWALALGSAALVLAIATNMVSALITGTAPDVASEASHESDLMS